MADYKDIEKNEGDHLHIDAKHALDLSSSSSRSADQPFQKDAYKAQQTKLQRQKTQKFMTSLDAISPVTGDETNTIFDAQAVAIKGTIFASKKTESNKETNVRDIFDELTTSITTLTAADITLQTHPVDNKLFIPEVELRDIRRLDNHYSHHEDPYILIRKHCVLISLGPHIRAIVQADKLMILVFDLKDKACEILDKLIDVVTKMLFTQMPELFHRSNSTTSEYSAIPFAIRAYGVLFSVLHSVMGKEFELINFHSQNMIDAIGDHAILSVRLQELLHKNRDDVSELLTRIKGVRKTIADLVLRDDLLFMNLQVLAKQPELYNAIIKTASITLYRRYGGIEPLIDSVVIDYRNLEQQAILLAKKIKYSEESVELRLDTSRNELLYASTVMAVFALCVAFSGYITGAFGMNLDNVDFIQPVKGIFWGVFLSSLVLAPFSSYVIIKWMGDKKILPSHAHFVESIDGLSGKLLLEEDIEDDTEFDADQFSNTAPPPPPPGSKDSGKRHGNVSPVKPTDKQRYARRSSVDGARTYSPARVKF